MYVRTDGILLMSEPEKTKNTHTYMGSNGYVDVVAGGLAGQVSVGSRFRLFTSPVLPRPMTTSILDQYIDRLYCCPNTTRCARGYTMGERDGMAWGETETETGATGRTSGFLVFSGFPFLRAKPTHRRTLLYSFFHRARTRFLSSCSKPVYHR